MFASETQCFWNLIFHRKVLPSYTNMKAECVIITFSDLLKSVWADILAEILAETEILIKATEIQISVNKEHKFFP